MHTNPSWPAGADEGGSGNPRAVRSQLAILESLLPLAADRAVEVFGYQPATVAAADPDGRPTEFALPGGRSLQVRALTRPTRALLVEPGRCEAAAVLAEAADRTAHGAAGHYASLSDVQAAIARHPCTTVPPPSGPAGDPSVLVLRRARARYAPAPWSVHLPGRIPVVLAAGCATKARARIVAGWLESTGLDFADRRMLEPACDALMELYHEWNACVLAALRGEGPWPENTPHRFSGILSALAAVADTLRGGGASPTL
ncbi:hypothetical protein [Kitasatospora sp. NPDC093679]|uniref:hypothetical protein n=1 Tax=Kitasatospora sp. NPDC093679 TaxID=3154983 RepID=UPI00344A3162